MFLFFNDYLRSMNLRRYLDSQAGGSFMLRRSARWIINVGALVSLKRTKQVVLSSFLRISLGLAPNYITPPPLLLHPGVFWSRLDFCLLGGKPITSIMNRQREHSVPGTSTPGRGGKRTRTKGRRRRNNPNPRPDLQDAALPSS